MDPDWTTRVQRLEAEVTGLRHSLRTRGLIEQAKGILAERHGIDLEEAFRRLVHTSQQTNVRVVDVAADVVTAPRPGDEPPERRRSIARVRTAMSTAEDPADLVTALYEEVAALGARAVAVHRARSEGGLQLLAAHGWPAQLVADWRSVPSALRTPGAEALRRGETLWLPDPGVGPLTLIGSGEHRTVLPVIVEPGDARPTVAVEVVWSRPVDRDDGALGHLHALAEAVAAWLRTAEHPGDPESGPDSLSLVAAAADAMPTPAVVLSPIDGGADLIVDYLVEHVNARGAGSWPGGGRSPVGRRLLDLEPALAAGVAMAGYAEAYRGEPQTCVAPDGGPDGCATRVGPALVVTWPGGDTDPASAPGPAMERLGGFGWAEWSAEGRPLVWSPGLDRLLGQAAGSPLSLDRLLRLVVEEDRAALAATLRDAATLRGRGDTAGRGGQPTGPVSVPRAHAGRATAPQCRRRPWRSRRAPDAEPLPGRHRGAPA